MERTKNKKMGSPLQKGSGRLKNKRNYGIVDSSNCGYEKNTHTQELK